MSDAWWDLPLGVLLLELFGSALIFFFWSPRPGVLFLGLLGRDSGGVPCQDLPMTCLELLVLYHKVIHCFWLPLMILVMFEGPRFSPIPAFTSTEHRGTSAKGSSYKIYLSMCLAASFLLSSVTERASGHTVVSWGKFSVRHQVGVNGVNKVNTESNSVPMVCLKSLSGSPRIQGKPAATCWAAMDLCGEAESQGVVRVRP